MTLCRDCIWWKRLTPEGDGQCYVNPPTVLMVDGDEKSVRPWTLATDYCSQAQNNESETGPLGFSAK